jgi:hypothetical protein
VVRRESTRSAVAASPVGARARCDDMHTGWMQMHLEPQTVGGVVFAVTLRGDDDPRGVDVLR